MKLQDLAFHDVSNLLKAWVGVAANTLTIAGAILLLRDIGCGQQSLSWSFWAGWVTLAGICLVLLQVHIWAEQNYPRCVICRWVFSLFMLLIVGIGIFPGGMLLTATCRSSGFPLADCVVGWTAPSGAEPE
ncbi:MAG: hypothetical protein ACK40I_09025 [Tabrizicola sp.]